MDPKLARGLARQYLRDIPSTTLSRLPENVRFNAKAIERIRRHLEIRDPPGRVGLWYLTVPKRSLSLIELQLTRAEMTTTRPSGAFDEDSAVVVARVAQFERNVSNIGILAFCAAGFNLHSLSRYLERTDDIDGLDETVKYASRWAIPLAHAAALLTEESQCLLPARGGAFLCQQTSVPVEHAHGCWEDEETATFLAVRTFLSDEMMLAHSFAELRSFCSDNDAHLDKHGPMALGLERERNLAAIMAANAAVAHSES